MKLAKCWKGPYCVIKDQGNGVYLITNIFDPNDQQHVNIQCLKKLQVCGDQEDPSAEDNRNPAEPRQHPTPDANTINKIMRMHIQDGTKEFFCHFVNHGSHTGEWRQLEEIKDLSLINKFLHFKLKGPNAPPLLNKETGFTQEECTLLIQELVDRQVQRATRRCNKAADEDKGKDKSW